MYKKDLFIFTDSYPYGVSEAYVANEIKVYHQLFNKIFIIPINLKGPKREIPINCEILNIHQETRFGVLPFLKALPLIIVLFLKEFVSSKHRFIYLKNLPNAIKKIYNAIIYAKALKIICGKSNEQAIFYSFWFYHWALVCAVAKYMGFISNYVGRAHLHDLYEIQSKLNYTNLKLEKVDKLYAISQHGKNFYKINYPKYINKIDVSYLGTPVVSFNDQRIKCDKFLILSCSSVRPAKRVDQIYKVICQLPFQVKWIHFGAGEHYEELKQLVLQKPSNVEIELMGHVPNTELLKYYSEHQIDLFINLSSQEGLPVSVMEAQSFGIPVLATDVFATNEAVVTGTGMLVKDTADTNEIVKSVCEIKKQIDQNEINTKFILDHWNTHFNAPENYKKFAENLIRNHA